MFTSTFGYLASKPLSSVSRNDPIPPSPNAQKSRVTGSPDPLSDEPPPPPPLSLEHAAAIRAIAASPTSHRRTLIRTLLTNDRRETPPIRPIRARAHARAGPPMPPRASGTAMGG